MQSAYLCGTRYKGFLVEVDKRKTGVILPEKSDNRAMATQNIGIPAPLLERVREAAAKEEITPEEFVRGAVETRLKRGQWRDTLNFGENNAHRRDLKPEDVEAEIAADRAERGR